MIFKAEVEKVIYRGDPKMGTDTIFSVMLVRGIDGKDDRYSDGSNGYKVAGNITPENCVIGLEVEFSGKWTKTKHGPQFAYSHFQVPRPNGKYGTIAFLQQAPGIGPRTAADIWRAFGEASIDLLVKAPEVIAGDIPTKIKVEKLTAAGEYLGSLDQMLRWGIPLQTLFGDIGFPKDLPTRIIKLKWDDPVAKITADPFCLMYFKRVGFKKCDKLRENLKLPASMPSRLRYAVEYALETCSDETWVKELELRKAVNDLLQLPNIDPIIAQQVTDGVIKLRGGYYALAYAARDEVVLATCVHHMHRYMSRSKAMYWPKKLGGILTDHQKETAYHAFENGRFAVLLGGAGTGKTTTGAGILSHFDPREITACAPTGKAAGRLTEAMEANGIHVHAKTIHRTLGCKPSADGFYFSVEEVPGSILVVDELGMLTNDLGVELFSRVPSDMLVLLLGDPYQLPPVGRGTLLRDWQKFCDQTGLGTYGLLKDVHRNDGRILQLCDRVRTGAKVSLRFDPLPTSPWDADENIRFVRSHSPARSARVVKNIIEKVMDGKIVDPSGNPYVADDVQVICALNDHGDSCKNELNLVLQNEMNEAVQASDVEQHKIYRIGDRVMCTKNHQLDIGRGANNPIIANGEMGTVEETEKKRIVVSMKALNGSITEPTGDGKGNFDLAYACTCHKMQGDQAKVVIVVCDKDYATKRVTSRQWLYTAVTRAQELCIVVGDQQSATYMIGKDDAFKKKSYLIEELEEKVWNPSQYLSTRESKRRGLSTESQRERVEKTLQSQFELSEEASQQVTTQLKDTKTESSSSERVSLTSSARLLTDAGVSKENLSAGTDSNSLL